MRAGPGSGRHAVLVRVAGLPAKALDALAVPRIRRCLDAASESEREAVRLAEDLALALHRLAPTLEPAGRRTAVNLRRDVHNGRLTTRTRRLVEQLGSAPPEPLRRLLASWVRSREQVETQLAAADDATPAALGQAGRRILAHLRDPWLLSGLAIASPAFTRRLLGSDDQLPLGGRMAQSAVSYLTRSAAKLSPFSTLTTTELARFSPPGGPVGAVGEPHLDRVVEVTPALTTALLFAEATHPERGGAVTVTVSPSLRRVDGLPVALLPAYHFLQGYFARDDELTDLTAYRQLLAALPPDPVRLDTLVDLLLHAHRDSPPGVAEQQPPAAERPNVVSRAAVAAQARRFLHAGLLLPAPATAVTTVAAVAGVGAALAATTDAGTRLDLDQRLRTLAIEAFDRVDAPAPAWVTAGPLRHENVAGTVGAVQLPQTVLDDLDQLAGLLRPSVRRATLYVRLVDHFVARYGPGGQADDIFEVLYSFLRRPDAPKLFGDAYTDPGQPVEDLRGHGTIGAPTQTAYAQIVAAGPAEVAAGDYRLVLNRLTAGQPGLLSRWAGVPRMSDAVNGSLVEWLATVYPGARAYQVNIGADWINGHRAAAGGVPSLPWPAEVRAGAGPTGNWSRLRLTHEPSTGTLQVHDSDGAPVAFTYLGSTPAYLLSEAARLLFLLSEPWLIAVRADNDRWPFDPQPRVPEEPTAMPAVESGRLVLSRRRWRIPAAAFPRPRPGESPARFLFRLDRWRTAHDLPAEVFCRRDFAPVSARKPLWVDLRVPHAVWTLLRATAQDRAFDLVEALPGRDAHWLRDADGNRRASELLVLLNLAPASRGAT
ncbi:hypothetical protein AB0D32_06585 [Micromonospora sp. NPDC048170]|uniref:hypothetical protein n=1 Tax=Micromonospora sp. NPDC048170 TaxID=3154819 RepID=UPI0033D1FCD4